MSNKKTKLISSIINGFFLFFLLFSPFLTLQAANIPTNPLEGLDQAAEKVEGYKAEMTKYREGEFLQTKVGNIIGIVLSFVGVIFLILTIYAGVLWMTAQGNDTQVAKAKDMLTNGIIGLVIVLAAYAITSFIGTEIIQ